MPRGWCPGVFTPMAAADGLLVRVKPRLSRLDAPTARRIATEAAACGNGRIELTSRANLQIRGLTPATAEEFARAMVDAGAADADPATERRRNIIVSPLAGADPTIRGRPEIIAAALERALAEARDLHLPAKFGFAVDGGGVLPLGDTGADVVVTTKAAEGAEAHIAGATMGVLCTETNTPSVALALARAFLALGGDRRMRDLVEAIGEDSIYSAAGMIADVRVSLDEVALPTPMPELTPTSLTATADRAERFSDGLLRVTPWRTLLIAHDMAIAA